MQPGVRSSRHSCGTSSIDRSTACRLLSSPRRRRAARATARSTSIAGPTSIYGQGDGPWHGEEVVHDEGNESHEGHEGHESDEGHYFLQARLDRQRCRFMSGLRRH